jgi:hypothetical protein
MNEHGDNRDGSPPPTPAAPWEQQEGESDAAYNRFVFYLQMGPTPIQAATARAPLGLPASAALAAASRRPNDAIDPGR